LTTSTFLRAPSDVHGSLQLEHREHFFGGDASAKSSEFDLYLKIHRRRLIRLVLGLTGISVFALFVLIVGVSWRNSINPAGIIIHHSATRYYTTINAISSVHASRGFGTFYWGKTYYIGYHYLILGDGTVIATRPEHLRGAHAKGYNSYIGICLIGNFSSKENLHGEKGLRRPTLNQMHSLYDLCNQLRKRYGFSLSEIRRHSDVNSETECPGDRFPYHDFIAKLSDGSNDIALTRSGTAPTQTHPSDADSGTRGYAP
jgi:hypothetical protein